MSTDQQIDRHNISSRQKCSSPMPVAAMAAPLDASSSSTSLPHRSNPTPSLDPMRRMQARRTPVPRLDESTSRYDHEHQAGPSAVRKEDKTRSAEPPFASSGSTWRARIVNDRHTGYFPPEACTTCASLQPPVECYSLQDEGLIVNRAADETLKHAASKCWRHKKYHPTSRR
jgi:hypothetical protein